MLLLRFCHVDEWKVDGKVYLLNVLLPSRIVPFLTGESTSERVTFFGLFIKIENDNKNNTTT